jgi:hypothetical protein
MKIHEVRLNNKNFWTPFWIASGLSVFMFLLIIILSFYQGINAGIFGVIFILLQNFIVLSLILSPPIFFIIKRLLSGKPKKVFYFELPILIIIYSIFYIFNQGIGLMIGGPGDTTFSIFLKIITIPIILLTVWLVLLTTSFYFYYKKKILKK